MSETETELGLVAAEDDDHGAVPVPSGEFLFNEQRTSYIAGLLEEKRGYAGQGLDDRVAEVDAELARVGAGGKTARKRAEARK